MESAGHSSDPHPIDGRFIQWSSTGQPLLYTDDAAMIISGNNNRGAGSCLKPASARQAKAILLPAVGS
ncbi:hypothetical protein XA68_15339 [Ophiocordyceps unilateralis]|uniref:Uncharacterized protein n=1 Tax=Ophiocordyceps unilateralis TaxID=268505 RepID=A0A2A9P6U9_OPHUN|nr:hypothetical protein XA68_15339 [Ophiocordyceps unilateralis]